MVILSQTTEYAVRATLFIAGHEPDPVPASVLADTLGLPRNYLSKTLGRLVQAGVLSSARGVTGGFKLRRPAESITLREITQAFAPNEPRQCLLGLGPCGSNPECAVHHHWLPAAHAIERFFASTTIADLVASPTSTRPPAERAAAATPVPAPEAHDANN